MAELFALESFSAGYGDAVVVEDVSVAVREGESVALLGRNGVGKTTLIAAAMGLARMHRGRVRWRAADVSRVPIINVHYCRTPTGSWDTHSKHFAQMKESLCPTFDQAFAALVTDLDERGLLGRTLVVANAEFGRTPKINGSAGRDHWPFVYSIALAGGGVGRGVVYGSSDKSAAYPTSHPHDPRDLGATIYHLLGVPADTIVHDQTNRPYPLVIGQRIDALLA